MWFTRSSFSLRSDRNMNVKLGLCWSLTSSSPTRFGSFLILCHSLSASIHQSIFVSFSLFSPHNQACCYIQYVCTMYESQFNLLWRQYKNCYESIRQCRAFSFSNFSVKIQPFFLDQRCKNCPQDHNATILSLTTKASLCTVIMLLFFMGFVLVHDRPLCLSLFRIICYSNVTKHWETKHLLS